MNTIATDKSSVLMMTLQDLSKIIEANILKQRLYNLHSSRASAHFEAIVGQLVDNSAYISKRRWALHSIAWQAAVKKLRFLKNEFTFYWYLLHSSCIFFNKKWSGWESFSEMEKHYHRTCTRSSFIGWPERTQRR